MMGYDPRQRAADTAHELSGVIERAAGQFSIPTYAQIPLCIAPGSHYFQLDHIKRDTAVCTRCGLIRKDRVK